jgi:anti-sigma B factor antagonist
VNVEVTQHGSVVLLTVEGTVDTLTTSELNTIFEEQINSGRLRLVTDLSAVDYMASAGLRLLLTTASQVRQKGGYLKIAAPNENVRRIMELAGIFTLIEMHPSAEAAIESCSQ